MHDDDDEYFSHREKDLNAERDYDQETLFDSPWVTAPLAKAGKHAKPYSINKDYMPTAYVLPESVLARISKAVEETIQSYFQQIMDRLDELEDGRRGAA